MANENRQEVLKFWYLLAFIRLSIKKSWRGERVILKQLSSLTYSGWCYYIPFMIYIFKMLLMFLIMFLLVLLLWLLLFFSLRQLCYHYVIFSCIYWNKTNKHKTKRKKIIDIKTMPAKTQSTFCFNFPKICKENGNHVCKEMPIK